MDASEILVSIMLGENTIPVGKLWCHNRKGRQSASFEGAPSGRAREEINYTGGDSAAIVYSKSWLTNPKRFALDPALTLTEGTFHTGANQSLFGAFGDSAPDRWGRLLMQRANETGRTLTEIDYLLGVNDVIRKGALRFSVKDNEYLAQKSKNSIPPLVRLPDLLSASEKILADKATQKELQLLLVPGSSLGGARPKSSVIDKDGSLSFAKFPSKNDENDIVRWEAVALTLAKNAFINTPVWRLENILGKPVLIQKRFDRIGTERVPFLSSMSMLGASDNDSNIYSYVDIANVLQQYGAQPNKDKEELWRRMVFGILISNTDDHLRNHGFLFTEGGSNCGWVLSPAYDLNPNTEKNIFSTSIDNSGSQNTIELAMKNIDAFNLSVTQANKILSEVKTAVSDWKRIAKYFGITQKNIDKMKPAFTSD